MSALRWVTFDDDGELTMTVLSVDGSTRGCSQSSSFAQSERIVVVVEEEDVIFLAARACLVVSNLDSFPRGGRIRQFVAARRIQQSLPKANRSPLHDCSGGGVSRTLSLNSS